MKYALVTGGSRGIGRACCVKLAEMGYNILINYNSNSAAAEETSKLVDAQGVKSDIIAFDVKDQDAVNEALDGWMEKNPDAVLEVLINNAGIIHDGLFMWMQKDQWQSVIDTSLGGFFNVSQYVIQKMLRARYGRIVNVVSLSGLKGTPGQTNYSAAKGAVIAATKALAQEVAKRNVTVNAVAPGFIASDMTADLPEDELKKLVPANRFGTPEEVADLVAFLASDKASYITAEVVSINGGIYS